MYIAIYRSKETRKITRVHEVENSIAMDLDRRVRSHNESQENKDTVNIVSYEDTSLEVFLLNRCRNIISDYKEELDNIAYAFDNLADKMHYFNEQREAEKGQ